MSTPTTRATQYTVSLLPDDHIDSHLFDITVEYRGDGKWGVVRMRQCLGRDGIWDYESIPSERQDEWLATHRFDLETALRLAERAAPFVRCNGRTAAQVAEATR